MPMSDIEIAQQAELWPIAKVADALGITDDELIPYGRHMAKVDVTRLADRPRKAKVVLVTAINPTPAGEGKTTTSVGLADALRRMGKSSVLALREPAWVPSWHQGRCCGRRLRAGRTHGEHQPALRG